MQTVRMLLRLSLIPNLALFAEALPDLAFVPNVGQAHANIRYIGQASGLRVLFGTDGIDYIWHGMAVRLEHAAANTAAIIEGLHPASPGQFRTLRYRNLYPGIDLLYSTVGGHLKSEYRVAAGADAGRIRFRYPGAAGVRIDQDGELVVHGLMELREHKPEVFQWRDGRQMPVPSQYELDEHGMVGFALGAYDRSLPLIIDPSLSFSTYLGGGDTDVVTSVGVDAGGNVYVGGWTASNNFPVKNAVQAVKGGGVDGFIAKLDSAGHLVYSTYLGGRGDDRVLGLAVTSDGKACVTGRTSSSNFPVVNAYQTQFAGFTDAFVACLQPSGGAYVYSTYLRGSSVEEANAIVLDAQGNAYVAGYTTSTDFPTSLAFQSSLSGLKDAFLTKFSSSGRLLFSTYLGGAGDDVAYGVAVDASGSAYVTGGTVSKNFPVYNAVQWQNAGDEDVFITKLGPSGTTLVYSTYLGGAGGAVGFPEHGSAIALDTSGNAYVTGTTASKNFPVVSAVQGTLYGAQDAFFAKLNPSGTTLVCSTYLGGSSIDYGLAIAVSGTGNAFITGYTASTDFPASQPLQMQNAGSYEFFIAQVDTSRPSLAFSTYLGGSESDAALALAVDQSGNVYIGGQSLSLNFPLSNAAQTANAGSIDGAVVKLTVGTAPAIQSLTPLSGSSASQVFTLTLSDAEGYSNIAYVYFAVHSSLSSNKSCFITYHRTTNTLELANDSGTAPVGTVTPAQSGIAENSQCAIDASLSSVSVSNNALVLKVGLQFKTTFVGTKNTYAFVADKTGVNSGWLQLGTWTVPAVYHLPAIISASPQSGNGAGQAFTLTLSDADGAADIEYALFVVHTSISTTGSCFITYRQSTNSFSLASDSGETNTGSIIPGGSGTAQNSQCIVDASSSSVNVSGNTLIIKIGLQFKPAFAGTKYLYAYTSDTHSLNSGWWLCGSWTVSGQYHAPTITSVSPQTGSGLSQTFTFAFSDQDGATDINHAFVVIHPTISTSQSCFITYLRASNTLSLSNDSGTADAGTVTLGSSTSVQNSQCIIDSSGSSAVMSGSSLVLTVALQFKTAFTGSKHVFGYVADVHSFNTGWLALGAWSVSGEYHAPAITSISPASGTGLNPSFTLALSDADGAADINHAFFVVHATISTTHSCFVTYEQGGNTLSLANDSGTANAGTITIGSSGTVQNSQCIIDAGGSSAGISGSTLVLKIALQFKTAFSGSKYIYAFTADRHALDSGWWLVGGWTIPSQN